MKSQSSLFWTATLLLTITSSSAYNIRCSKYDSDFESQTVNCNAPSEYCGIDKTTGAIQGCVSASQCPANVADNRIIVCDSSKPSCCCLDSGGGNPDCNDILHPDDDSQWKQACTISHLQSPSDVCKVNPTRRVFCAFDGYYGRSKECKPFQFCGLAKTDGEMKKCLSPKECPSSAKGSKPIVCDGSASHCCCQDIVDRSGSRKPCNLILNDKDSTIWQQACSLAELKNLPVCQDDPSKRVHCNDPYEPVSCPSSQFCGIDKTNGQLAQCLDANQCPSGVSEAISCDSSKPFCCCQRQEGKYDFPNPCNYISNTRDNTIWKQACSLPELKDLAFCQEDPTKALYCTYKKNSGWETSQCKISEFCGIDKSDGEMHKCLDSSECPGLVVSGAADASKVVCDDSAPYCCCRKVVATGDWYNSCNNILDEEDSSIWEQACKQEELKSLPVCQHDPNKKAVYCSKNNYAPLDTVSCKPFQFCGIDKSKGQMRECLDAEMCPAAALGSDKIFCDDDDSHSCCCQKVEDKVEIIDVYGTEDKNQNQPSCNNFLNWKDHKIWKQACALEQLKDLNVCKSPPTESTPRPPLVEPTDGSEEYGNQEGLNDWEIALIVISVLIIFAILACVLFYCYKKRGKNAARRGGAVQGQQQGPANEQGGYPAAQMPPEGYYPVQQGYNLQAGQSAPLVPVNPAYQQPTVMSMPNVRYY